MQSECRPPDVSGFNQLSKESIITHSCFSSIPILTAVLPSPMICLILLASDLESILSLIVPLSIVTSPISSFLLRCTPVLFVRSPRSHSGSNPINRGTLSLFRPLHRTLCIYLKPAGLVFVIVGIILRHSKFFAQEFLEGRIISGCRNGAKPIVGLFLR
jgi:hypothetical protein